MAYGVKLRVWGEYACFTRPEMKVERVSYDVMTPRPRGRSWRRSTGSPRYDGPWNAFMCCTRYDS